VTCWIASVSRNQSAELVKEILFSVRFALDCCPWLWSWAHWGAEWSKAWHNWQWTLDHCEQAWCPLFRCQFPYLQSLLEDPLKLRKSDLKENLCSHPLLELDGEARACSRVRQTKCKVWQSITRWRTSIESEESSALRMNWSCYFQQRKEWFT